MSDDESVSGDCTCGGTIAAGRRDGFCSSWCRGRDVQGLPPLPPPPLVPVPPPADAEPLAPAEPESAEVDAPTRPRYRQRRRLIADEVEARLDQAGLLGHWQASTVLDLADSLDWTGGSLSARSAAHRELERQMTALTRGQDEAGSVVGDMRDDLAARRLRRGQVAG